MATALMPTEIWPSAVRNTGILGKSTIGTGPTWMLIGGLSISPIGQWLDPAIFAVRLEVAVTDAEADTEAPSGMRKCVWISTRAPPLRRGSRSRSA